MYIHNKKHSVTADKRIMEAVNGISEMATSIILRSDRDRIKRLGWKIKGLIRMLKADASHHKRYHFEPVKHSCLVGEFLNQDNKDIFNRFKTISDLTRYIFTQYKSNYYDYCPSGLIKRYLPKLYGKLMKRSVRRV